jgi:hypothetical protein
MAFHPIAAGDGASRPRRDRQRVRTWGDVIAELVEQGLQRLGRDGRQHQSEGDVALRADGAEQMDRPIIQALGRWSLAPVGRVPRWNDLRQ